MRTYPKVGLVAILGMLSACSDPPPPAPTAGLSPSQATEIQQAIQKPMTATSVAVDQVHDTQRRMDQTLNEIQPQPNSNPKSDQSR